jgi:hypothetical protein
MYRLFYGVRVFPKVKQVWCGLDSEVRAIALKTESGLSQMKWLSESMFCPFSLMKKGGKIKAVNRHRLKNQNSLKLKQLIFLYGSTGNVLNAICSRPTQKKPLDY